MKSPATWLPLMFVLAGCGVKSEPQIVKLAGTWEVTGTYPGGAGFRSTIDIDRQGVYVAHVIVDNQSGPRTADVEGIFHFSDGMLVDTVMKHSNTNAVLPMITRSRIVRIDSHEMLVHWEPNREMAGPMNDVVFRRVQK